MTCQQNYWIGHECLVASSPEGKGILYQDLGHHVFGTFSIKSPKAKHFSIILFHLVMGSPFRINAQRARLLLYYVCINSAVAIAEVKPFSTQELRYNRIMIDDLLWSLKHFKSVNGISAMVL